MRKKREKLTEAQSFKSRGLGSKQMRAYHKLMLLMYCEVVERKPDLVFPMSTAESKLVMKLGWQSFDRLCYVLAHGKEKQTQPGSSRRERSCQW